MLFWISYDDSIRWPSARRSSEHTARAIERLERSNSNRKIWSDRCYIRSRSTEHTRTRTERKERRAAIKLEAVSEQRLNTAWNLLGSEFFLLIRLLYSFYFIFLLYFFFSSHLLYFFVNEIVFFTQFRFIAIALLLLLLQQQQLGSSEHKKT